MQMTRNYNIHNIMKTRFDLIAEKTISVATCIMVTIFALAFAGLALCAGFCAITELDLISLVACIASALIARFWFGFLRDEK